MYPTSDYVFAIATATSSPMRTNNSFDPDLGTPEGHPPWPVYLPSTISTVTAVVPDELNSPSGSNTDFRGPYHQYYNDTQEGFAQNSVHSQFTTSPANSPPPQFVPTPSEAFTAFQIASVAGPAVQAYNNLPIVSTRLNGHTSRDCTAGATDGSSTTQQVGMHLDNANTASGSSPQYNLAAAPPYATNIPRHPSKQPTNVEHSTTGRSYELTDPPSSGMR
ncbi:hypothetical protein CVT26_004847 [Gymnopilus dilepis]|uniref:Uncharacterized protein n=1 Tax=Gymnopilus dilepis TaxID=231916 RepID=A0A409YTR5_9AGAR|nr:hypothetical protein CVT26_004847 [Gymnopilus dilepis]